MKLKEITICRYLISTKRRLCYQHDLNTYKKSFELLNTIKKHSKKSFGYIQNNRNNKNLLAKKNHKKII